MNCVDLKIILSLGLLIRYTEINTFYFAHLSRSLEGGVEGAL